MMKSLDSIKYELTKTISKELVEELVNVFGDELNKIILYGSYSRETFTDESDIDVMVLLETEDNNIIKYEDKLIEKISELDLKYGKVISVVEKNYKHFMNWVEYLPFYRNVYEEGVLLYDR